MRCHSSAAGPLPRVRSRWTQIQPVSSRRLSIDTPAIHTRISVGSSGSIRTDGISARDRRSGPAIGRLSAGRRGRRRRGPQRIADRPSAGVNARRRPRRPRPASARSAWNFWTPLTTGSVSISARPTADDHVADVRRAPAQGQQRQRREGADHGPLPDELQERPAHGLGGRLAQQGLNRGHLGPPSRSVRRQSPSGCPAAPRRTRACWRAPA